MDNCNVARVATCGTCSGLETCAGGGVANVCGCTAESNTAFCTRVGAQCGAVTATDNCGTPRTVASCGGCSGVQTCAGGGSANVCGCTGETDAAFCTRMGRNCGTVTGTDNCLVARTVTSCGACGPGTQCGAQGVTNNTCLPLRPLPSGICTVNGWCWQAPGPMNEVLKSVSIDSDGAGGWAVGANGTVVRWDGATLRGWWLLRPVNFNAVWSNGPSDAWVVGPSGLVLRWNGSVWNDLSIGQNKELRGVWGTDASNVWVVGASGVALKWNGTQWTNPLPVTSTTYLDIFPTAPTFKLVGYYGLFDVAGTTVTSFDTWSSSYQPTHVVNGQPGEIYASRSTGSYTYGVELTKYIGAVKTTIPISASSYYSSIPTVVAPRALDDVWALYTPRTAWRFNGTTWTLASLSTTDPIGNLNDASSASGKSLTVGSMGSLYERDATAWRRSGPTLLPTALNYPPASNHVVPMSATRVAVSLHPDYPTYGSPYVFGIMDGAAWVTQTTVSYPVRAAWSPDGTTLWGIQSGSTSSPQPLLYWNGTSWTLPGTQTSVPGSGYSAMAGTTASDIWASGTGTMLHYDGTNWTQVTTPFATTTTSLDNLVAKSASLAFARGYPASVIRWNGAAWTVDTAFLSGNVYALWSPSGGDVWAVGAFGLRRFTAGAWTTVTLPADVTAGATLWGTSDSDVYLEASLTATGATDLLLHWDGSVWTREQFPTGFFSNLRVVMAGGQRWAYRGSSQNYPSDTTFGILK